VGDSVESWFQTGANELAAEEIDALIIKRTVAREGKDFATSDQIRDSLLGQGVVLEDGPDGTTWRYQADN
jgi:cysteinyl-tRNA synthetase